MSAEKDALRGVISGVLCNAMNFPEKVVIHILGRDMGPLIDKTVDALTAAGYRQEKRFSDRLKAQSLRAMETQVEIGGQTMTQAQFDAARFLLLDSFWEDDLRDPAMPQPRRVLQSDPEGDNFMPKIFP